MERYTPDCNIDAICAYIFEESKKGNILNIKSTKDMDKNIDVFDMLIDGKAVVGDSKCIWENMDSCPAAPEPGAARVDSDGDGSTSDEDCDDNNPEINPEAEEICNGIDNNCDGSLGTNENPSSTGAAEACDGKDNNCDGRIDEGYNGDIDANGKTNVFDMLDLLKILKAPASATEQSDTNNDGKTDIFDLLCLLNLLKNG